MICTKGELSPPKIRPEMRAHNHCRRHLPTRRTVPSLRKAKASAGIRDNHLPIALNMVQNSPTAKKTGIRVQQESSILSGKTQYWSTDQASFQSLKRRLLSVRPNKRGPFPRQCHQRFRQSREIHNKLLMISHKTHKLALSGACQFRIVNILAGSHASPVRPTICPRKATSVCIKVHFLAVSCSPKSLRWDNTSSSLARASGIDVLKEITSSR